MFNPEQEKDNECRVRDLPLPSAEQLRTMADKDLDGFSKTLIRCFLCVLVKRPEDETELITKIRDCLTVCDDIHTERHPEWGVFKAVIKPLIEKDLEQYKLARKAPFN